MIELLAAASIFAGALILLLVRARLRRKSLAGVVKAEVNMLEQAALRDSLTDLGNHRAFERDLARVRALHAASGESLCLIKLDVDGLKQVNDSRGHQAGDDLLREVAAALEQTAGKDGSYRVGGDEFAMLLRGRSWDGFNASHRVRDLLLEWGGEVEVTAGVAEFTSRQTEFDLVHQADLAQIAARRTRRGVVLYSAELEGTLAEDPTDSADHSKQVLVAALTTAVEAKDSYTKGHSETASNLCVMIASELGLEKEQLAKLRIAGLLHDVGKIGTPDAILSKPATLTEAEYEVIKEHPVLGEEIVDAAELPDEAHWIRHHHERMDGAGYPDALAGNAVPLESRIIMVADAFEAIISDRPYRKGRPEREALDELERCSDSQFDRSCVDALRDGLRSGGLDIQGNRDEPEARAERRSALAASPS